MAGAIVIFIATNLSAGLVGRGGNPEIHKRIHRDSPFSDDSLGKTTDAGMKT